jgi:EAL and modified HD-GYP domain-containing signal transduction protein
VRTIADMEAAFARGAHAVLGWPIDDAIHANAARTGKGMAQPDMQVVVELIHRVDNEESIDRLENTLKRDPSLAFKLLRYINSPAFGLRVEISSFRHAIMLLGYQRLKRWLALLLATASKDVNLRPIMFAAVRRGLLMEELVAGSGDEEMRNEVFICGVFSLLDRMFQESFAKLLGSIPVPSACTRRWSATAARTSPTWHGRAAEGESVFEYREAAEQLLMSVVRDQPRPAAGAQGAGALE